MFFGTWIYYVLAFLAAVLAAIYAYFRFKYQEWTKRGFPVPIEPSFPFGNFPGATKTRGLDLLLGDLYKRAPNERFFGAYLFCKPIVVIRDLDLMENIFIKDFAHFRDRGFEANVKRDPLMNQLAMMSGKEWRNLRIKLTPTFTTGKMKMMFPTLIEVGRDLEEVLGNATESDDVEIKDILSRYTTDVVSSVGFGIVTNSLKNPDNEFRNVSMFIAKPNLRMALANLIIFVSPKLAKILPISLIPRYISEFFIRIVTETMEYRIKNNIHRNDFMQLLLELKTLGYIKDADNREKVEEIDNQQEFTLEQAAAQAFLFFFAGFEPSSSLMQFALYELAINPDMQEKAQQEIDQVINKHEGKFTYECLQEMEYLDRVVSETLRKYPVAAVIVRKCNDEYEIPGSDVKLLPGDAVWFPVYGYHHDPLNFPDPAKFDPDRFLPEVKETRHPFAFMPFGDGPRSCIGNRFALMQIKTGLALVLASFTLSPSKKTPIPLEFDPKGNVLTPKGKLHLKISKREK